MDPSDALSKNGQKNILDRQAFFEDNKKYQSQLETFNIV
jgi:hypothetical protein